MTEKLKNPFKINELITAVNSLVDSEGGSNPDNISITQNTNNELQAVGVINQNNTTSAIKTWTGTKAQYNAIVTKDNNTLYNITDDMQASTYEAYSKSETYNKNEIYNKNEVNSLVANNLSILLTSLYPVGSIYIGTQSTCPLATLISGSTWVKVSEGRVLQGSDSNHNAGTTIEAGLPNLSLYTPQSTIKYGSQPNTVYNVNGTSGDTNNIIGTNQPAKLYIKDDNNIVGNSTTVQPPAYVVNIWQRTA